MVSLKRLILQFQPHSEMIATYALCGFSNVVALGIMIGALTAAAPSRKEDIIKVSWWALIAGCMACFMTACVAGQSMFYYFEPVQEEK